MDIPTEEGKKRYPPNGIYKGDFLMTVKVIFGKFVHVNLNAQIHVKDYVGVRRATQIIWIF